MPRNTKYLWFVGLFAIILSSLIILWPIHSDDINQINSTSEIINVEKSDTRNANTATTGGEERSNQTRSATNKSQTTGTTVYGEVIYGDSEKPVKGATVLVSGWQSPPDGFDAQRQELLILAEANTKEDGSFKLEGLPPGRHIITAEKAKMLSFTKRQDIQSLTIGEADKTIGPIVLSMEPVKQLTITVKSASDGKPIEAATVGLDRPIPSEKLTDPDGKVRLNLTGESWVVFAFAPGFAREEAMITPLELENTHEFVLQPGGTLVGTITNEDEQAIEGATIWCFSEDASIRRRVYTDEKGNYEIPHVPIHSQFGLGFHAPKYNQIRHSNLQLTAEKRLLRTDGVLIRTQTKDQPTRLLSGQVVDQEDNPIANATVAAGFGNATNEVQTDEQGTFSIELEVHRFRLQLRAYAEGFAVRETRLDTFPTEPLTIVLQPGFRVGGVVTDVDGNRIPGARFKATLANGQFLFGGEAFEADDNGEFEIGSIPEKARFMFWSSGYSFIKDVELSLDLDNTVVLPSEGFIKGLVVDEQKRPITSVTVKIADNGTYSPDFDYRERNRLFRDGLSFGNAKGAFQIQRLNLDESYTLVIQADGFPPKFFEGVQATHKDNKPEVYVLENDTVTIAGIVIDENNRPVVDAQLALSITAKDSNQLQIHGHGYRSHLRSFNVSESTRTEMNGTFRFDHVPRAYFKKLLVDANTYQRQVLENLESLSDENLANLTIQLSTTGRIFGRVNPELFHKEAMIYLNGGQSVPFDDRATITGDGQYSIDNIPAGQIHLLLSVRDQEGKYHTAHITNIELANGEQREYNIGFEPRYNLSGIVLLNERPAENWKALVIGADDNMPKGAPVTLPADGTFIFTNLIEGDYRLGILPPGTPGYRVDMISENAQPFKIAGRDHFQEFRFVRQGTIYGRLMPVPAHDSRVILVPDSNNQTNGGIRQQPVGLDGRFSIQMVTPGYYSLNFSAFMNGTSVNTVLLEQIQMPIDGSDIDLGDISLDLFGTLRVRVEIPADLAYHGVQLRFHPGNAVPDAARPWTTAYITDQSKESILEKIPLGILNLEAKPQWVASKLEQSQFEIEISEENTATITLRLIPVTALVVQIGNINDQYLTEARLIHIDTGQEIPVDYEPNGNNTFSYLTRDETLSLFVPSGMVVRDVRPGTYRFILTDSKGQIHDETVALTPGILVQKSFNPTR